MTVVGNEQRVYGKIAATGSTCHIWLGRFAVVKGGEVEDLDTSLFPYLEFLIKDGGSVIVGRGDLPHATYNYGKRGLGTTTRYWGYNETDYYGAINGNFYVEYKVTKTLNSNVLEAWLYGDNISTINYEPYLNFEGNNTTSVLLTGDIVSATKTSNVSGTPVVVYGDSAVLRSCGHTYNGYLSLLFYDSGATSAYAVFEIRKCKSGKSYIFVETYGEIASTSLPISLWFNQGSSEHPDWIKLNSCTTGVLPYHESTFKFDEKKGPSWSTTIENCQECNGGKCLSCGNLCSRFQVSASFLLPIIDICVNTFTVSNPDGKDLSSLVGQKIYLYKWEFNHFAHAFIVTSATENTITVDLDTVSYYEGYQGTPDGGGLHGSHIECYVYSTVVSASIYGPFPLDIYTNRQTWGYTFGIWPGYRMTSTWQYSIKLYYTDEFGIEHIASSGIAFYLIYGGTGTGINPGIVASNMNGNPTCFLAGTTTYMPGYDQPTEVSWFVVMKSNGRLGSNFRLEAYIELLDLTDCKGVDHVNESEFKMIAKLPAWYNYLRINDSYPYADYEHNPPTTPLNLTGQCAQIAGSLVTSKGAFSLRYGNYIAIDYKLFLDSIDINAKTLNIIPHNYFYNVTYTDQEGTAHQIINNTLTSNINVTYPFDYLSHCI